MMIMKEALQCSYQAMEQLAALVNACEAQQVGALVAVNQIIQIDSLSRSPIPSQDRSDPTLEWHVIVEKYRLLTLAKKPVVLSSAKSETRFNQNSFSSLSWHRKQTTSKFQMKKCSHCSMTAAKHFNIVQDSSQSFRALDSACRKAAASKRRSHLTWAATNVDVASWKIYNSCNLMSVKR